MCFTFFLSLVIVFFGWCRTSDIVFICLPRGLRGVAIDVLGDYDVIGLNTTQKRIFIIECKVLQPIGSVFEHSNQQKRFFTKEKFDEKFQKRIDYFSKVAMSFFANHGYDTEGFTINPYMVVNKVFSSYYKHVQFPIVTFDELKREIQL